MTTSVRRSTQAYISDCRMYVLNYPPVGSNRRYPGLSDQLAQERELRTARARGPLHTLTAEQLRLNTVPVTIAPNGNRIMGRAWLRFGDADVRATVRLLRWTDDAAGVEVTIDGDVLRCWVWRGALTVGA